MHVPCDARLGSLSPGSNGVKITPLDSAVGGDHSKSHRSCADVHSRGLSIRKTQGDSLSNVSAKLCRTLGLPKNRANRWEIFNFYIIYGKKSEKALNQTSPSSYAIKTLPANYLMISNKNGHV